MRAMQREVFVLLLANPRLEVRGALGCAASGLATTVLKAALGDPDASRPCRNVVIGNVISEARTPI